MLSSTIQPIPAREEVVIVQDHAGGFPIRYLNSAMQVESIAKWRRREFFRITNEIAVHAVFEPLPKRWPFERPRRGSGWRDTSGICRRHNSSGRLQVFRDA